MKRIATLAVAITAALALMGIGSASAGASQTVLCAKWSEPCQAADVLPAGSALGFGTTGPATGHFAINDYNGFGWDLRCTTGFFSNKTTAEAGSPLPAEAKVSVEKCGVYAGSELVANCSSASAVAPNVRIIGTGNAEGMVSYGSPSEPFTVSWKCSLGGISQECTYKAPYWLLVDQQADHFSSEAFMQRVSGSYFCGETAALDFEGTFSGVGTISSI